MRGDNTQRSARSAAPVLKVVEVSALTNNSNVKDVLRLAASFAKLKTGPSKQVVAKTTYIYSCNMRNSSKNAEFASLGLRMSLDWNQIYFKR